jgi:hypothetical protein
LIEGIGIDRGERDRSALTETVIEQRVAKAEIQQLLAKPLQFVCKCDGGWSHGMVEGCGELVSDSQFQVESSSRLVVRRFAKLNPILIP